MSEKEREGLKAKEQQNNPGGALNNAWAKAHTGSPDNGCLVNIGSVVLILAIFLLIRTCSN